MDEKAQDSPACLTQAGRVWVLLYRRGASQTPTHPSAAYFLLSGSFSLIFSRTLISSRAASLYFSTFLMIFRATRAPPLWWPEEVFAGSSRTSQNERGCPGIKKSYLWPISKNTPQTDPQHLATPRSTEQGGAVVTCDGRHTGQPGRRSPLPTC